MTIHGSAVSTETITHVYSNKGIIISMKKSKANDKTHLNSQTHAKMNCLIAAIKSVSETQPLIKIQSFYKVNNFIKWHSWLKRIARHIPFWHLFLKRFSLPTVNRQSPCSELADGTDCKWSWEKGSTIQPPPFNLRFWVTLNVARQRDVWADIRRFITRLLCENRRSLGKKKSKQKMNCGCNTTSHYAQWFF